VPKIKNNVLILIVVGLLAVADIAYPLSRMFKYFAFQNLASGANDDGKKNFSASAIFEGLYLTSFTSALWIFALKFWALSIRLEMVFKRGNPDELKTFTRLLYFSGIFISIAFGLGIAISTLYYIKGKKTSQILYVLNTIF